MDSNLLVYHLGGFSTNYIILEMLIKFLNKQFFWWKKMKNFWNIQEFILFFSFFLSQPTTNIQNGTFLGM